MPVPKIVPNHLLRNHTINVYLRKSEKQEILKELESRGVTARDVLLDTLQQDKNQGEYQ